MRRHTAGQHNEIAFNQYVEMIHYLRIIGILIVLTALALQIFASTSDTASTAVCGGDSVILFRFVPGNRTFYSPFKGNDRAIRLATQLIEQHRAAIEAGLSLKPDQLSVTMFPRTYSYLVRYRFKSGLEYVAQTKGALTGMADKAYLHDGHTDATPATLLFDCKVDDIGCTTKVMSFDVPNFAYKLNEYTDNPAKLHFVLHLEVMQKNGKRLNYNLDVSDIMRAQPRGGILLFPDIEVSDKDGNENTGGFDPDVGDWEDVIDIPLPID